MFRRVKRRLPHLRNLQPMFRRNRWVLLMYKGRLLPPPLSVKCLLHRAHNPRCNRRKHNLRWSYLVAVW